MVEHIVDIGAEVRNKTLTEMKILMHADVHSPRTRTMHQVPLGDCGIVKDVSAHWRKIERIRIPNRISNAMIEVSGDERSERRLRIEVAVRVNGGDSEVPWSQGKAIITKPKGGKSSSGLGKHFETGLPPAQERICP